MAQPTYSNDLASWLGNPLPTVVNPPQSRPTYAATSPYAFDVPPTDMRRVSRTSNFGPRKDPFTGRIGTMHSGTDYGRAVYDGKKSKRGISGEPLKAVKSGIVTYAGPMGRAGNVVRIDHGSGFQTQYFHMQDVKVAIGDRVQAGWQVGTIGGTGSRSTAPHLHIETIVNGQKVDPAQFMAAFENPEMVVPDPKPPLNAPLGPVEVAQLPDLPAPTLEPGPSLATAGATAAGQFGSLAPVSLPPLEAGPVSTNIGATAQAQAAPGSLAPTPVGRIDGAFDVASAVPQLPSAVPQDPLTPRSVPTERIQTTSAIPQAHPGYPGQPAPAARPDYSPPPAPMPVARNTAVPALPEARPDLPPTPIARSTAVPALPQARPEQDLVTTSTNGVSNDQRVLDAHELAVGLPQYDPATMGAPMVGELTAEEYSKARQAGTIPTVGGQSGGIPTIGAQDPTIPTAGIPSSVPGSLGPQLPGTTTVEKQDRLPSAVEIAAEGQKQKRSNFARNALGIAGGIGFGTPGAIAGAGLGTLIDRGAISNPFSGFSGFGGTGGGSVGNAIQAGYAAGSPYNNGYDANVARQSFYSTPGSSDAQTVALFDYENARARGVYDEHGRYTGAGYGGASGVSQEARDSIDFSGPGLF